MKKVFSLILMTALLLSIRSVSALACTEWCGMPDIDVENDVLPPSDQLHTEAYLLGDAVIGRTLHVLRSGNVRTAPTQSSVILTEAFPDDKVAILDYYMESANPLNMWLKIDFYGMEGWINASRGKVVSCPPDSYIAGNDPTLEVNRNRYVGQTMMVNVKSGNARSGPGKDYPTIEYIHKYDTYRIRDVALDDEGKLWVMIRIGSRECWVRDSLFDYIGN